MVKRYYGGVVSATAKSVSSLTTSGIFNTSDQLQEQYYENWPGTIPPFVEYLIVAGGGGGGAAHAGGGGAGGFSTSPLYEVGINSQLVVTVGSGGAAGTGRTVNGFNGSPSKLMTQPIRSNLASWYFNGASDIAASSTAGLNIGTVFTIELWFYRTSDTAAEASLIQKGEYDWRCTVTNTNVGFYIRVGSVGTVNIGMTATINNNTWYHYAVSSDGTNVRLFLNGVLGATASTAGGAQDSTRIVSIGVNNASVGKVWYFPGYITGVRVVKGTSLYTTNFTIPTEYPTNISGTALLLNPTSSETTPVDASGSTSLTNNGTILLQLNPFTPPINSISIDGGGGGGSEYKPGVAGASGGGGATNAAGASGIAGIGNAGGTSSVQFAGGGGGGAGGAGSNTVGTAAGNGGVGLQSSITGTATYYSGGGGGGSYGANGNARGTGGLGGGGNGNSGSGNGTAGTTNTGGGGGGGGYSSLTGYAGGSGIVILRYPLIYMKATNLVGNPTYSTANGYRIYTFTSSGSLIFR